MSVAPTTPTVPVIALDNLLFDYPGADVILRSCDSYEFHVLKTSIFLVICSPGSARKMGIQLNSGGLEAHDFQGLSWYHQSSSALAPTSLKDPADHSLLWPCSHTEHPMFNTIWK